jgi:hypothetical protein
LVLVWQMKHLQNLEQELAVLLVELGANCWMELLEKRSPSAPEHYFVTLSPDDQLPMRLSADQGLPAPCQTFTRQFVHCTAHAEKVSDEARRF